MIAAGVAVGAIAFPVSLGVVGCVLAAEVLTAELVTFALAGEVVGGVMGGVVNYLLPKD